MRINHALGMIPFLALSMLNPAAATEEKYPIKVHSIHYNASDCYISFTGDKIDFNEKLRLVENRGNNGNYRICAMAERAYYLNQAVMVKFNYPGNNTQVVRSLTLNEEKW